MIESEIVTLLEAATGVTQYVGTGGIYPEVADQEPPYITYRLISATRNPVLTNVTSNVRNARMQFDCWSKAYLETKAIAEAIVEELVTATGLQCVLNLEQDGFDVETKTYRAILDFSIWKTATG